jgi:hypothetical protein
MTGPQVSGALPAPSRGRSKWLYLGIGLVAGLAIARVGPALIHGDGGPTADGWPEATVTPRPSPSSPSKNVFDFIVTANERKVGTFPYLRRLTEFDPDAGWIDGDRVAYRCGYTFLVDGGEIVARVTFTTWTDAQGYAVINDRYMEEGQRFFDGSPAPPGTRQVPDSECPVPSERYAVGVPDGPVPRITFSDASDGHTVEVRDYTNLSKRGPGSWCCGETADPGHAFRIASATPDRVTVVMYQNERPVAVVYYDRLSDDIRLSSNARIA